MRLSAILPIIILLVLSTSILSCDKEDSATPPSTPTPPTDPREMYTGTYMMRDSVTSPYTQSVIDNYILIVSKLGEEGDSLLFQNIRGDGENAF